MNADYTDLEVERKDFQVEVATRVQNLSRETWNPGQGFAFGIHIFDRATETLIVDGPRVVPGGEILPGESLSIALAFDMPPEPGEYRVLLSPMAEDRAWFYELGWSFILIDGTVDDAGNLTLQTARVADSRTLRWERFMRSFGRAFILPIRSIVQNRSLIRSMVRRDILGRFRGSFGGWFWTILNPLLLMSTYFFVFGIVMRPKVEGDTSPGAFALYLIAGMLPWLAFSEAVGRAPVNMLEHRQFIKKLVFPIETLPFNIALAGLISEAFGLAIYLIGLLLSRGSLPISILWLPVLVLPQVLFTAGVCWFLAALGVFFRDLAQINGFVLTLWFFLTPICYPETALETTPALARTVLSKNPMYVLVHAYRDIFLRAHAPNWIQLAKFTALAVVIFFLGHAWFHKLKRSFADVL